MLWTINTAHFPYFERPHYPELDIDKFVSINPNHRTTWADWKTIAGYWHYVIYIYTVWRQKCVIPLWVLTQYSMHVYYSQTFALHENWCPQVFSLNLCQISGISELLGIFLKMISSEIITYGSCLHCWKFDLRIVMIENGDHWLQLTGKMATSIPNIVSVASGMPRVQVVLAL